MRTKTIVLSALCGLIGSAAAMAQSVYSVNAVGYVNTTFKAGQFKLIANPLNAANNTLGGLFPTAPDGSAVYKWTSTGFDIINYVGFLGGWERPDVTLNPGEGAFFLSSEDYTVTFVGEVMQGSLANAFPVGFSIVGSQVPQAGNLDDLGLTAQLQDEDAVYTWGADGYSIYSRFFGAWMPDVPSIGVGEAVFLNTTHSGNWTRSFSINPAN